MNRVTEFILALVIIAFIYTMVATVLMEAGGK